MATQDFERKTKEMIDGLKAVCASYGLGNDGNEFKIITQVFLYKFLNDKFAYEVKKLDDKIASAENWEAAINDMDADDFEMLLLQLPAGTARLQSHHFIANLFENQNDADFAKTFDDTLFDIAVQNNDIFAVKSDSGSKMAMFDRISVYISDESKRDDFCRAIINKIVEFSFEHIFTQKFDFYATIFEYLISDYNKDSGGKYAEYYTPHAVAKIMAEILVPQDQQGQVRDVTCYDPSAGSGTLLMNLAHAIGENRCSIYSQDISQKSSSLLRLNLILNNLVHSIQNVVQGNTILNPAHKDGDASKRFDYIVSNPPFKMDFSDFRDRLDTKANNERFFAGIPKIAAKKKESMAIYQLFLQHIIHSLSPNGKAAMVVPTGFLTAQSGIDKKIRQKLVDEHMLAGVVSMPSNIFATTGTNVSIIFIDRDAGEQAILIDASKLGTTVKEGKNQKTVLSSTEELTIINTFNQSETVDDLSVAVASKDIQEKNYSFSAGQYFELKIEYIDITEDDFTFKLGEHKSRISDLSSDAQDIQEQIDFGLARLNLD
ncbi:putative type I restriction enzymeP M protein [Ascidiaceihabitans donghaensis]|uniref:site-specific DNA-methyltransferase (adenine-specific) n=1 Tax=Ascidiaceihabitans donghaensis TaxID=1510460 RepID=A0A2R8BBE4_9RHOB|nr:class I SAM-dependent DNA methyltransferase [Ascidiaceihabitans donghaensis]SPH20339.1 putative type I restriction enzymeP M protein [Ascidiaceihabitans donghaensis]